MDNGEHTILVAEDNEDDVFFLKHALMKACLINPLQFVGNGRKARDYLAGDGEFQDRKNFPMPCLVFLDLKLPGLTGFEVLDWIRTQPNLMALPVVILSGSSLMADITTAHQKGAASYLVKPPTRESLEALENAVGKCWLRAGSEQSHARVT